MLLIAQAATTATINWQQVGVIVSGSLSLMALIVSGIALYVAWSHNKTIRSHNDAIRQFASAGSETSILALITNARGRLSDVNLKIQDARKGRLVSSLSADDKRHLSAMETAYHDAVEILLNAYELACGMYLDGKLDKERFKRQYIEEVRKFYAPDASEAFKKRLEGVASPYRAIRKVYAEWHDHEK